MLRARSLSRFFVGLAILYAASNGWATLLLWQALVITHSGTWVALAAATTAVPAIVVGLTGPEWGFPGRMGAWLWVCGVGLALLAPWSMHWGWLLLTLGLGEGWVTARIIPRSQAWLMAAVFESGVPRASQQFEMASRIGLLAGPILAGALISTAGALTASYGVAFLFLVAGGLWYGLGERYTTATPANRRPAAWRSIQRDGFLLIGLGVRAGANLLWPAFTVAVPLLVAAPWHAQALGYGLVRTIWGLSTVMGAWLIIPRLFKHLQLAYFLSWVLTGIAFWRIGLSAQFDVALMWVVVGALFSPVVHVALDSHIGLTVTAAQQGGVFAIQRLVMAAVNLIGLLLMTGAIERLPPGFALSRAGLVMAGAAAAGFLVWLFWNATRARLSVSSPHEMVLPKAPSSSEEK